MYEVFVNEKPVKIFGNTPVYETTAKTMFLETSEVKKMMKFFSEFSGSDDFDTLILTGIDSPEKQFRTFASGFRMLEAAGGFVTNGKHEALFIYRFGRWDLPKGKIESGEHPREAALREVAEETGIPADRIVAELNPTYHVYDHKGKLILKKTYWYRMQYTGSLSPVPQSDEGIDEARWVAASGVGQILGNTYASLHRLIMSESAFL